MKKSSFLHNPKDMLSKSFKPAKCKMSLKLAASRLKLLKNKKEVQVKQMKRELAQLLDSGQDQTARIRVEHVIREEKMMAAYDLIEIYCELIVARLPIIESQKNCPIDLKEAITSVIFASPRCGDIPELLDVRKHLTVKYGKEFTSAAIDLRPNCGVSRMLVEKLSAKAPDGQAKLKVLTAIAEEHNIKWDPKSFGESETMPNDLLNGPSTFENANKMHAEDPHFVPDGQAPPSYHRMDNQQLHSPEENVRSSHATQNLDTQVSSVSNAESSISQSERRHSGARANREQIKQEFHEEGDAFSFSQQSWGMDFKDATAAAEAAAESAQRASRAARAAAELSSRDRIARQHSTESRRSDTQIHRDEGTRKRPTPRYTNDYHPKDSANVSYEGRNTRVPNMQNTESESFHQDDHGSDIRSAQTFSSRSEESFDNYPFHHNVQGVHDYPQKSLFREKESSAEMDIHSHESEAEYGNHLPEDFNFKNSDYYGEERVENQSFVNSASHSNISGSDDKNLYSGSEMVRPHFSDDHSANTDIHMHRDSLQSGSHDSGGVIFDESDSDGEDFGFDMGSRHEEFHIPSPDRNLTMDLSADAGNFGPVTFDDSDGQNSEDETVVGNSRLHGTKDSGNRDSKENLSQGSRRSSFSERQWKNDQRTETSIGSLRNFDSSKAPTTHSSPRWGKSESSDSDSETPYHNPVDEVNRNNSSHSRFSLVNEVNDNVDLSRSHRLEMDDENSGDGKGLNFEKLTGGFRHKGYTRPPFIRNQLDNISSSSRKGDKESPTFTPQSNAPPAVDGSSTGNIEVIGNAGRSRVPSSHDDSDSDSSEEEFEKQPSSYGQEYLRSADKDVKSNSSSRNPVTYFRSESSDSEDDSRRQVFPGRSRLVTGVSRRTKVSPSSSGSISHPKRHASSVVLETPDSVVEKNPTTSFYSVETPQPAKSERNSNMELHGAQPATPYSKQTPESSGIAETQKIARRNSINREEKRGEKVSRLQPKQKPEASDNAESQKTASGKAITREDSGKKASHVHPKLPDYDTLAARIQALRTNRQ